MKKESYLYKKLSSNKVQCRTCNHYCTISNGKFGFCGVRKNVSSKLYFMNYGQAIAENVDPIEKKPLFDFLPRTNTLTIATVGCNFCCQWCQNADISQITKINRSPAVYSSGFELTPRKIIKDAFLNNCPSISYSYTEPTIFLEYALDTMKLAREKGLKNIWVTNGFMSRETLKLILPYLDAANVDLKSFADKVYQKFTGARLKPILDNIRKMKRAGVHLEITTLVVPTINNKKSQLLEIAQFIKKELSVETPWHITRYYPAHKMQIPPAPIALFHDTEKMAKVLGLKKVYTGNF